MWKSWNGATCHLRDSALHDNEVRIIDVKLYGLKKAEDGLLLDFMPV